jgi:uncharacterized protein
MAPQTAGEKHLIDLAPDLKLPIDAVTQKLAHMGRTGSGKTYGAMKLAEQMLALRAQIVALDPVGVWWGLRVAADGKSPGLSIPVFGGLHGDVPLEPTAGALIADLIVDRNICAVVDVSQMISAEQARFVTAFAIRLFERRKSQPAAMMIFLEEAQEFVPQNPQKGEEKMLHAFQRLCKIGRNFGIGVDLISQRPQEVNKKVLNMTECVFCFQMTGPQEREAIRKWVSEKGEEVSVVETLPKLAVGHAHVWSPQWLQISRTVHISKRSTYNASSTPIVGAKPVDVAALAPVDFDQIRAAMADTIERQKADDPRELRKRIAELERAAAQAKPAAVDTNAVADAEKRGYERGRAETEAAFSRIDGASNELATALNVASDAYRRLIAGLELPEPSEVRPVPPQRTETKPSQSGLESRRNETTRPVREMVTASGEKLSKSERKVLIALAQYPAGRTKVQIAILTGYAHNGGGFNNSISALRSRGLLEGSGESMTITRAGLGALGSYDPLPSGRALADHWMGQLSKAEKSALQVLIDVYPRALDKATLAIRAGYEANGGGFNNALSRLRTLELITGRGEMRASEDLF